MWPRPAAQEHSALAPAPAGSAIPNPAPARFEKIKSGATLIITGSLGSLGQALAWSIVRDYTATQG